MLSQVQLYANADYYYMRKWILAISSLKLWPCMVAMCVMPRWLYMCMSDSGLGGRVCLASVAVYL